MCLCRWYSVTQALPRCKIPPSTRCPCFSLLLKCGQDTRRWKGKHNFRQLYEPHAQNIEFLRAAAWFVCHIIGLRRKTSKSCCRALCCKWRLHRFSPELKIQNTATCFCLEPCSLTVGVNTNQTCLPRGHLLTSLLYFYFTTVYNSGEVKPRELPHLA